MSDSLPLHNRFSRRLPLRQAGMLLAACSLLAGCQSGQNTGVRASNPALKPLVIPAGATQTDIDRAALARLVGAWTFEGWSLDPSGARQTASGRAAAAIENEHFVLLDLDVTNGQLGGRSGRKGGSMLFAVEPGIGATVTAWGDASASINRLFGKVEANGSFLSFTEAQTPSGRSRLTLDIKVEADDRWSAELRNADKPADGVFARYTFTRDK